MGAYLTASPLAVSVSEILADVESVLTSRVAFDPSSIKRKFRLATKDYGAFLFVPVLMQRIGAIAPGVDLEVWDTGQNVEQSLSRGDVDIAVTDDWELRRCKRTETLFRETFTCLVQQQHPRIHNELTLEQYTQE